MAKQPIAYFSMEVALDAAMPTYAGGLGILASDTLRTAADLDITMIGITLLYRHGYFRQHLDQDGWQSESPLSWEVDTLLNETDQRVTISVAGRTVALRAWRYDIQSPHGASVPVYFLDTDLKENSAEDRTLSHALYGGDATYRLSQEILLGIGGVRMLRALGYDNVHHFQMNEGHSALLTLELLDEEARRHGRGAFNQADIESVRKQCVFTTHTPVPAGHDQFLRELGDAVLGRPELFDQPELFCRDGLLNLTSIAMSLSAYVNGVSQRHGEIARRHLRHRQIDAITNGIHAATWAAPSFQALFDRYLPKWRKDHTALRRATMLPSDPLWNAHSAAKQTLIRHVNERRQAGMTINAFTIRFARRATTYKRTDLIFHDLERLKQIAASSGALQIIYAGKAHPKDHTGREIIHGIVESARALHDVVRVVYLKEYGIALAKLIIAGVDLWLNTPQPPLEASGTSGMKVAVNGVPNLSILDGWWVEGYQKDLTGWVIGGDNIRDAAGTDDRSRDAVSLYGTLEQVILPLYYHQRDRYLEIMRHEIALNGSYFNTQRMLNEYVARAYNI